MLINVLNLNDSQDGNRIKQGDLSHMRYILSDTNNDDLKLDGLPAKVFSLTVQVSNISTTLQLGNMTIPMYAML